jgi:hypothetical protein
LALAEGYYGPGSAFGRDLVRDLRRLIERVRDGDNDAAVRRLVARIKWNCQCNEYEIEQKVRALAREILNDWEAVIAFVAEPLLSPSRVDDRRGGCSLPVGYWRRFRVDPSVRAGVAPSPVAAHRTGRADFPHRGSLPSRQAFALGRSVRRRGTA